MSETRICPFCGKETDKFIMFRGDIVGCRYCGISKKQTNADRIRSMSDEELAEFMCHNVSNGTVNCAFCGAKEFCRMGHNGWLDWLRQEVAK